MEIMATKVVREVTVSDKLIGRWEQVCAKLAVLAEEVPANRFDYRPGEGLRTVADVFRHVAFWNSYVADTARGKKADDNANELPKERFSTKAQVIDALKKSAADAAEALKQVPSGLSSEQSEMLVSFIEHNSEHYGQLVVYARLNGIVPPASRG
jgi:uncharacterized damage-inducible protein DinB